jgi:ATP/maltotriose-dependent transcriptional regulator MalT
MPSEKTHAERSTPPTVGAIVSRIQEALDALVKEYAASFEALAELEAQSGSHSVRISIERDGFRYVLARFPPDPERDLTSREWQVVAMAAGGCSNLEIAQKIGVKHATVAAHLRNVYAKWGVASRGELLHRFYSRGGRPQKN